MASVQRRFLALVLIGIGNVLLSFIYGNQGYEAFLTVSIALGLLMTWQVMEFGGLLIKNKMWLAAKLVGASVLVFFWAVAMIAVIMPIADPVVDPKITLPSANWLLVGLGVIPYAFSRLIFSRDEVDVTRLATNIMVTFFSIVALFIAIVTFYGVDTQLRMLVLVVAVELQFLLNYLIVKTNYINWAGNFADNAAHSSHSSMVAGDNLKLILIGLPFFIPLFLIILLASF